MLHDTCKNHFRFFRAALTIAKVFEPSHLRGSVRTFTPPAIRLKRLRFLSALPKSRVVFHSLIEHRTGEYRTARRRSRRLPRPFKIFHKATICAGHRGASCPQVHRSANRNGGVIPVVYLISWRAFWRFGLDRPDGPASSLGTARYP